jgi:hypothetical protein
MKNNIFLFAIFLLMISMISACKSNFDCDTLCCINETCSTGSECKKENAKIYGGISAVAFVFLVTALIYMCYNISETRESIKKMQQEIAEKELNNSKVKDTKEKEKEGNNK